MRIKILILFFCLWILAHMQESKQDDEVQKKASNFESAEYGLSNEIKEGQGGSGHGGNGASHGGSTGGGSSSSGGQQSAGVLPHNAGGSAQQLRNQHRGGSSYNKNAGHLTIVAIFLAIMHNTPSV